MELEIHSLPIESWLALPDLLAADGFTVRLPEAKGRAELRCGAKSETFEVRNVISSRVSLCLAPVRRLDIAARLERILICSDAEVHVPATSRSGPGVLGRGEAADIEAFLQDFLAKEGTRNEERRGFCQSPNERAICRFGSVDCPYGRIGYETGLCFNVRQRKTMQFLYVDPDFPRKFSAQRGQYRERILSHFERFNMEHMQIERRTTGS
ncbi:hypothetical protein WME98_18605 [Sorangium sp. So ce296]|uniref:hypothetical protein n=1 Tax=Sorangium sp. So ce296 TaxID=3133296 RepID=UPI003F63656F